MITIENFETEMGDIIVDRGYEYFLDDAVASLIKQEDGKWKAIVQGTNKYRVNITITKNEIEEWECNCPYDYGPVCKHVAAVLFELQHHNDSSEIEKFEEGINIVEHEAVDEQIFEILESISNKELKNFIQLYAEENDDFRLEILSEFSTRISSENKSDYRKILKNAYYSAMDQWGFIEYGKTYSAVKPAQSLLDSARKELDAGHFPKALEIAQAVLEESVAVIQDSDDSSGSIGEIVNNSFDILFKVAEQGADSKMRKDFFDWCMEEAKKQKYADFDWEGDLLNLSIHLIDNEKQENELFELLGKFEGGTDEEFSDYTREKYATIKLRFLKQRRSAEEVQRFLQSNIHFSSFRKELIKQAIQRKDYATAKDMILGGIDYDTKQKHYGTVHMWKDYLMKIAQYEKETETVRKLSMELFTSRHYKMKYYRIWKNTFEDEEKDNQIEGLIKHYRKENSFHPLTDIFIEEKQFKELLEIVKKSPDIYTIETYESYLKPQFPKELVEIYEQAVTSFLERNTGRRYYREACRIMQKMQKLGGEKTVKKLAKMLRVRYPRRPALIDELHRF